MGAIVSRRRTLFAAATSVVIGSGITAGAAASVADLVPPDTDADLIAACAHFNALERQCRDRLDAATTADEEDEADRFRVQLFGASDHRDWPALTRVCTTPASSLAAAVALATTISTFDSGDIIARQDDPDGYVTSRLLAALMRCLLASA